MNAPPDPVCRRLSDAGHSVRLAGWSALDRYFGLAELPFVWLETDADLAALARLLADFAAGAGGGGRDGELRFPGVDIADAALDSGGRTWYFFCDGSAAFGGNAAFALTRFYYDPLARSFYDPAGTYPLLRALRDGAAPEFTGGAAENARTENAPEWFEEIAAGASRFRAAADAAVILSRYADNRKTARHDGGAIIDGTDGGDGANTARAIRTLTGTINSLPPDVPPGTEAQRALLSTLLLSPRPKAGLELLRLCGVVEELWPELSALERADHSKEYHPEGNGWAHTLETLRYRKAGAAGGYDLRLSLALLLHDTGKPFAGNSGGKRFNGHAEIGAREAARFLERLGFESGLRDDVYFLVKNHMLPAALPRLPPSRTEAVAASPLFPLLLELYRCDESSSFKGLDNYYESAAAYKKYLRRARNPWAAPARK